MASVGGWDGVLDFSHVGREQDSLRLGAFSGFLSFLVWRFAYWGKQVSLANKFLIPMYWFKAFVFGRDISRF
jgi:NADH dehydrogenase FAD-containing subunit